MSDRLSLRPMQFIKFKDGVDASGVHPHLWFHLGIIGHQHWVITGHIMVATSIRRPYYPGATSKHSPQNSMCTAADIRRWNLDKNMDMAEQFCKWIQHTMGDQIGVVLEPEWGDYGGAPHIHIQSKRTPLFKRLTW